MNNSLSIKYITRETKAIESLRIRLKGTWENLIITQTDNINERLTKPEPDLIIVDTTCLAESDIDILADSKNTPTIVKCNFKKTKTTLYDTNSIVQYLNQKEFKSSVLVHTINHLLERRKLVEKLQIITSNLQNMTIRDDLTGLYNSRYMDQIFDTEFKKAKRYKNSVSAMIIGIDGLKGINETYGYDIGNRILVELAMLLQGAVREVDTIARLNGDEFTAILPATTQEESINLAERIKKDIHNTIFVNGRLSHSPTASIGIAEVRAEFKAKDEWIEAIRKALLEAKHSGKDQICTIDDAEAAMHPKLDENSEIIKDLQTQIHNLTEETKNSYFKEILAITKQHPFYKKFIIPHSERVAFFAEKIANKLGLSEEETTAIKRAGLLHDLGKVAIDKRIILKSGNLSTTEYDLIKQHPIFGIQIMSDAPFWKNELTLILHHHEWFDGRGYPDKLKGNHIPTGARILAITEAWDTMTTDQLYRPAISLDKALEEIKRNTGTQFDPEISEVFIGMIEG